MYSCNLPSGKELGRSAPHGAPGGRDIFSELRKAGWIRVSFGGHRGRRTAHESGSRGYKRSNHPTDRMIRDIVVSRRQAAPAEIQDIVTRMATAPFGSATVKVPQRMHGRVIEGKVLGRRVSSLTYHVAKRVDDGQWEAGLTAAHYMRDIRQAVRHSAAGLAVYRRRGGTIALSMSPNTIEDNRLGMKPQPYVVVVYSADRGILVTAYQASSLAKISMGVDVRWLRQPPG